MGSASAGAGPYMIPSRLRYHNRLKRVALAGLFPSSVGLVFRLPRGARRPGM